MKILLTAATAAAALATGAAHAQDATDYSGFYLGGFVGGAKAADKSDETILFDRDLDGAYDGAADAFPNFRGGFSGDSAVGATPDGRVTKEKGTPIAGARLGWDYQAGNWVLGGLAEIEENNVRDAVSAYSDAPASYVLHRDLDNLAAVRARVGYAWNGVLPYVTAGAARGEVTHSITSSTLANTLSAPVRDKLDGYQAGVGVEKKVGSMSVGLEYLYTSLKDEDYAARVSGGPAGSPFTAVNANGTDLSRSEDSFDVHALRATAAYRF